MEPFSVSVPVRVAAFDAKLAWTGPHGPSLGMRLGLEVPILPLIEILHKFQKQMDKSSMSSAAAAAAAVAIPTTIPSTSLHPQSHAFASPAVDFQSPESPHGAPSPSPLRPQAGFPAQRSVQPQQPQQQQQHQQWHPQAMMDWSQGQQQSQQQSQQQTQQQRQQQQALQFAALQQQLQEAMIQMDREQQLQQVEIQQLQRRSSQGTKAQNSAAFASEYVGTYGESVIEQSTAQMASQSSRWNSDQDVVANFDRSALVNMLIKPIANVIDKRPDLAQYIPPEGGKFDQKRFHELIQAVERQTGPMTTFQLTNIPKTYSRTDVVNALWDLGFKGKIDFIYVPRDFDTRQNSGYAFVNLVNTHEGTAFYRKVKSGVRLESDRPLEVRPAETQGFMKNLQAFFRRKNRRRIRDTQCMPLIWLGEDKTTEGIPLNEEHLPNEILQSFSLEPRSDDRESTEYDDYEEAPEMTGAYEPFPKSHRRLQG